VPGRVAFVWEDILPLPVREDRDKSVPLKCKCSRRRAPAGHARYTTIPVEPAHFPVANRRKIVTLNSLSDRREAVLIDHETEPVAQEKLSGSS
jgi:hypothetical protein